MSGTLGTFSGSLFLFGTFTINCQHGSALVGFVKKSSPRGSKFLSKNADHCVGLGGGGQAGTDNYCLQCTEKLMICCNYCYCQIFGGWGFTYVVIAI